MPATSAPSLPLELLLFRLEQAGFRISPGDRLRAYRVLAGPGKTYLSRPDELKYLLAPILCRSGAEQTQFYAIFDAYLAELQAIEWELGAAPMEDRPRRWWIWALVALAAAAVLYLVWLSLQPGPLPPQAAFAGPTFGAEGDTIRFENTSSFNRDSSQYTIAWELRDERTGKAEWVDTQSYHWQLIVPELTDTSYRKEVWLRIIDPAEQTEYVAHQPFIVLCPVPPDVVGIEGLRTGSILAGTSIGDLRPLLGTGLSNASSDLPWIYEWDMGDSTRYQQAEIDHRYAQPGRYGIVLTVLDTSAGSFCSTRVGVEVEVKAQEQDTLIALPPMAYQRMQDQPVAGWRSWVWQVPYFLALFLIGLWGRWWASQRRRPVAPAPPGERPLTRIISHDQAPYYVPWQDHGHYLPLAAAHFRLADAMRLRQAGLRQHIDVGRTVGATIRRGGYPDVRYARSTRPSEYLLLIDEEAEHSHLGRLFRHLAGQLRGQDVFAEVFYYRKQLNRFWNAEHPEGMSLSKLAFHHTKHRLLILGDAHELLDPGATTAPRLRPESLGDLRAWRERLLLTPQPPVSWTYREKLLAQYFAVFPADLRGLSDAAQWLETNAEDPSELFDSWQERQKRLRQESDVEYRRWRRWRDHADYLADYPALRIWFLALAVYPRPNWELTIAMGRALREYGVEIDYDNLLYLARIPSLREGRFEPRLRREMLAEIDPTVETIARRVVREELAAVRELAREGHASLELESELAMQTFTLDPDDAAARETIALLLKEGLLTPQQRNDLQRSVSLQEAANTASQSVLKTVPADTAVDLDNYFAAPEEPTAQPAREPVFNTKFWAASTASLLVLALFATLLQTDRTVPLQQWLFGPVTATVTGMQGLNRPVPRRNWLAEEVYLISGAQEAHDAALRALAANEYDRAESRLWSAIRLQNYQLSEAEFNLLRLYYNQGRRYFNDFQANLGNRALLDSAGLYFQRGVSFPQTLRNRADERGFGRLPGDTTRWDPLLEHLRHGLGLTYFFQNNVAIAEAMYVSLPGRFFDTLSYSPNLQTFVAENEEASRLLGIAPRESTGNATELVANYYLRSDVSGSDYVVEAFVTDDTLVQSVQLPSTKVNGSAAAVPGLGTATVRLTPLDGYPQQADSILVLLREGGGKILDRRWLAYPKDWTLPADQRLTNTTLRAQDALTEEVLDNVQLTITDPAGGQVYNTYLHTDGRVALPATLDSEVVFTFRREGYQTREMSKTAFDRLGRTVALQPIGDRRENAIRLLLARGDYGNSLREAIALLRERDPEEATQLEQLLRQWERIQQLAEKGVVSEKEVAALQQEIREAIDRHTGGFLREQQVIEPIQEIGAPVKRILDRLPTRTTRQPTGGSSSIPLNPQVKETKQRIPQSKLVGDGVPLLVTDFDGSRTGRYRLDLNLFTNTYNATAKMTALVDLANRQINVQSYSHFASKSADDPVIGNGTDVVMTQLQKYIQFRLYLDKSGTLFLVQVANTGGKGDGQLRLDASTWEAVGAPPK